MPTYSNGYVPEHLLIIFKRGWNKIDGNWYWGLPPATYAKHLALVARARTRNPSITLTPTDGFSCYRPYWAQVIAKQVHGIYAADPGSSSHGGFWERRQTLAIDYHNWSAVYGGSRAEFYADVRAVGLTPGMISRERGYPDEPWHVIDLDPWGAVPAFDGVFTPFQPEEDDMFDDQARARLDAVYAAIFGPQAVGASRLYWPQDGAVESAAYGMLPVGNHTQALVGSLKGQVAALTTALEQVKAGGGVDLAAIRAEAEAAIREALGGLTVTISTGDAPEGAAAGVVLG